MVKRSVRFSTQVLLLQIVVLLVVCATGFGLMAVFVRNDLIQQYEQRALAIARSVAADGRYQVALAHGDPSGEIQTLAERVRRRSGALFVVVTDTRGIRFSHPDPALLGRPVDPDQAQALDGREVTLFGPDAVGTSARGKTPIRDAEGAVVGQVIAAIDADALNARLFDLLRQAAAFVGIALLVGTAASVALTRRVHRQTFGFEPAGLRLLLEQQAALRRVATLVARGEAPTGVFDAVAAEVSKLLRAQSTNLFRYETDGTATVVAAQNAPGVVVAAVGSRVPLDDDSAAAQVRRTGLPARADIDGSTLSSDDSTSGVVPTCAVGAPVIVEGTLWGAIVASWTGQSPVPGLTEEHIAEFTELVASAVANTESRAELTASRARVVAAADETRRRIERDLHDGTQQRLVSLAIGLRAAEASIPPELSDLRMQLSRAATGLVEAVADLQEISRGIHPAVLARGGLVPALKTLARRSAVPIELDLSVQERLPEAVEVAVYYVASEALTNATKHARASVVHVELQADLLAVRLSVRDDGVGGADATKGSGLIGLRDRVEALGGKIEIASAAETGTSLFLTIPLASTQ
ncbi:MAG: hypothetical protein QOG87_3010 [Actinomycetota bacterium]|jgi:signal transduction histidine kinase